MNNAYIDVADGIPNDVAEPDIDTDVVVQPTVPKYICPTEKKGYRVIDKTCYFIEKQRRKFGDAQDNCNKVFDNRKEGRLFEPRTQERNDKVSNVNAKADLF